MVITETVVTSIGIAHLVSMVRTVIANMCIADGVIADTVVITDTVSLPTWSSLSSLTTFTDTVITGIVNSLH